MPWILTNRSLRGLALGAVEDLSTAETVSLRHHQPDGRAQVFFMELRVMIPSGDSILRGVKPE